MSLISITVCQNEKHLSCKKESLLNTIVPLSDIEQAGVLLIESGKFVFCYGPHHASNGVYVLRIGGHRESGESAWVCAAREAQEEASAVVRQIPANVSVQTIGTSGAECAISTLPTSAIVEGHPEERPLVVGRCSESEPIITTLFLAETDGESRPNNEVFGLVKLTKEEVIEVAHKPHSFSLIQTSATPQRSNSKVSSDAPIVLSTHLCALAYCLEHGYV